MTTRMAGSTLLEPWGLSPHLHPLAVVAVVLLLLGMVPEVGMVGMMWEVVVVGLALLVVVAI